MLIAIDKSLEHLKQFLEMNGYKVSFIDDMNNKSCDVYIYEDDFTRNAGKIITGDNGTLLIKSSEDFMSILTALKTKLITPIF